ncbi:MAG TPA: DUF4339 domain-containing protein [Bacillota bacterium]|nr:DUF4339 domain-containing protein [Bacillota bacterium]
MYRIRKDGQSFGPFTEDEIRELYKSGSISSLTETAREGTDEWKPLSQWNIIQTGQSKSEYQAPNSYIPVTPSPYQTYNPEPPMPTLTTNIPSSSPLIGVILIAVLYGISSLVLFGVALFAFYMQHTSHAVFSNPRTAGFALIFQSLGVLVGIFALSFAILHACIVYGLAKMRNWARVTVIVLSGLGLFSQLRSCLLINSNNSGKIIFSMLITISLLISIILYLSRPNVRLHFN